MDVRLVRVEDVLTCLSEVAKYPWSNSEFNKQMNLVSITSNLSELRKTEHRIRIFLKFLSGV
jgi:hypothetical protein